jgi:outer membrane lipoprotein-sorting protein
MTTSSHRTRLLAIVPIVLAAAATSAAQTAQDIVARYVQARGGLARLKSLESIRMTGTMTGGPGDAVPIVIELKRPAMMRMDMTVNGTTGTQAFDGTSGWVLMPFAGMTRPERMPPDVVKEAQAQADFDGPLVDYTAKGHTVTFAGRERANGRDAYRLDVRLQNGSTRVYWLDASTYLEVKSSSTRTVNGATVESETTLADYREVDGLMFPFRMESGIAGAPEKQQIVLESVTVNVPIDDARFQMPQK